MNAGGKNNISFSWIQKLMTCNNSKELKEDLLRNFPGLTDPLPKKIAVIGTSHIGEKIIEELTKKNIDVENVFDHDIKKHGTNFKGIQVRPFEEIEQLNRDTPIILATHRLLGLQKKLKHLGFRNIWSFPLLSIFDSKNFTTHPFYELILEKL